MIRSKNLAPGSASKQRAAWALVPCLLLSSAVLTDGLNAQAINAIAQGGTVSNSSFYTRIPQNIAFTVGGTFGATSVTFTINGENVWGDAISETMTFAATGVQYSLHAYRRITSIVATSVTGTVGAATISIGYPKVDDAGVVIRIPAPFKVSGTASVLAAKNMTIATQPTSFVVRGDPYWTIDFTTTTGQGTSVASMIGVTSTEDANA